MSYPHKFDLWPYEIISPYNSRAMDMWAIIDNNIDFNGKSVLDVGCGYGDMLLMTEYSGASKVVGVDVDRKVLRNTEKRASNKNIRLLNKNIETMRWDDWDIIICFSVLPYMKDPDKLLYNIRKHSNTALLECQYAGDGPGFENINNNSDMREWLSSIGWERISNLGYTDITIRNKKRTIWRLQ